jgi:DNA cross-link repair 1A protein
MASARESLKRLPDSISQRSVVDGFQFQRPEITNYFLTHYHGDHTVGLDASFRAGTIYCSAVTAALVVGVGLVDAKRVVVLAMDETSLVDGIECTPFDANHRPGAVCLHFRNPATGATCLHTGDLRAAPCVCAHPTLLRLLAAGPVDTLYLDTTYFATRTSSTLRLCGFCARYVPAA